MTIYSFQKCFVLKNDASSIVAGGDVVDPADQDQVQRSFYQVLVLVNKAGVAIVNTTACKTPPTKTKVICSKLNLTQSLDNLINTDAW